VVSELTTEMCAFPGCERPVAPAPEGAGRPSRYCDVPEHNAQSAFRERRRRASAGELDGSEGAEQGGGDRPVSLAGATLRAVAVRLVADLERTRDALGVLTDTEQLEAELAAVRADTQAEISHAARPPSTSPRKCPQDEQRFLAAPLTSGPGAADTYLVARIGRGPGPAAVFPLKAPRRHEQTTIPDRASGPNTLPSPCGAGLLRLYPPARITRRPPTGPAPASSRNVICPFV